MKKILEIKDLKVSFDTHAGEVQAVRGVSFDVNEGETLAIVGESGSGKSVTIQTIMKLLPSPPVRIKGGQILYNGEDITTFNDKEMRALRGKEFSMIFQDPMTSLNPTMRIGRQISEGVLEHTSLSSKEAKERTIEMMKLVGIPSPDENMMRYPHTYSGGMRQRIMIAMGLATNPKILFADEPTTALDVTMQAQILELMNELKKKLGTAIVLITHNLGVVAKMADRVAVMYAGRIIEMGSVEELFYNPKHPYTWGLLNSMPDIDQSDGSRELVAIPGTPPDLFKPPVGCAFAARCTYCMPACLKCQPYYTVVEEGHVVSCHLCDSRAPKVEPYQVKRRFIKDREVTG